MLYDRLVYCLFHISVNPHSSFPFLSFPFLFSPHPPSPTSEGIWKGQGKEVQARCSAFLSFFFRKRRRKWRRTRRRLRHSLVLFQGDNSCHFADMRLLHLPQIFVPLVEKNRRDEQFAYGFLLVLLRKRIKRRRRGGRVRSYSPLYSPVSYEHFWLTRRSSPNAVSPTKHIWIKTSFLPPKVDFAKICKKHR